MQRRWITADKTRERNQVESPSGMNNVIKIYVKYVEVQAFLISASTVLLNRESLIAPSLRPLPCSASAAMWDMQPAALPLHRRGDFNGFSLPALVEPNYTWSNKSLAMQFPPLDKICRASPSSCLQHAPTGSLPLPSCLCAWFTYTLLSPPSPPSLRLFFSSSTSSLCSYFTLLVSLRGSPAS